MHSLLQGVLYCCSSIGTHESALWCCYIASRGLIPCKQSEGIYGLCWTEKQYFLYGIGKSNSWNFLKAFFPKVDVSHFKAVMIFPGAECGTTISYHINIIASKQWATAIMIKAWRNIHISNISTHPKLSFDLWFWK